MEAVDRNTERRHAMSRVAGENDGVILFGRHQDPPGNDEAGTMAYLYPPRGSKAPGRSSAILGVTPSRRRPELVAYDEAIELPVHVVPLERRLQA